MNSNEKDLNQIDHNGSAYLNKIIKSEDFSFDYYNINKETLKHSHSLNQFYNPCQTNSSANSNLTINKANETQAAYSNEGNNVSYQQNENNLKSQSGQSLDEIFKIAKKAEELLREFTSSNQEVKKNDKSNLAPVSPIVNAESIQNPNRNTHLTITQQPARLDLNNLINSINQQKSVYNNNVPSGHIISPANGYLQPTANVITSIPFQQNHYQINSYMYSQQQQHLPYTTVPLPHQVDASFFATNPPPSLIRPNLQILPNNNPNLYRYPFNNSIYPSSISYDAVTQHQQQLHYNNYQAQMNHSFQNQRFPLKRKFSDTRYNTHNAATSYTSSTGATASAIDSGSSQASVIPINDNNEDDDLNIMRERELKDLKCKSVVEKMSVFCKYYQQFKDLYQQRLQTIECSDSLKMQFHSLIKYLLEYEQILLELNVIIKEHEHDCICKNNHRKTKKFFNKTKAFIRYECYKRLQSNIFEYRRQINSQDRFAGMYDILDMNNYLIGLLPDLGVSIRRYINRCEKSKQLEEDDLENNALTLELDDFGTGLLDDSESSNSSVLNTSDGFSTLNDKTNDDANNDDTLPYTQQHKDLPRSYESFSKGVDSLNRYLLKRVENEESLDELVKERIIKWINKRQSKYILIFGEVDKLLNQHKDGECYSKFHSFLLFNLGKLVTVCDSYHQKLKELLYSTTIRRKKKRKKVKIVPESMSDVFAEVNELKRALEHTKLIIKRCNEVKPFPSSS